MRSRAKLNYEGVARALGLSAEAPRQEAAEAMRDDLRLLREISTQLRARRMRRGALDLELPEAKVVLQGKTPIDVVKRARDPGVAKAYQIVEEFMLLANEAVASFLIEKDIPAIFRNHGTPDPEKVARFSELCERLGVPFDTEEGLDPRKLSAFLKKTSDHERKQVLHMVLMRTMKQAVYDVTNQGHFGLASDGYVHFTSPIRRYPDVVVHREVKAVLRGEKIDRSDDARETMRVAAVTASERERRAMTIERQVVDLCRALIMRDKVGAIYGGTVSGISMAGAYVAIDEPFVDILVRNETLGTAAYEPDEIGLALVASVTGDRIELGDAMMVEIQDVSITRRTVFGRRLRDESEDAPRARRAARRGHVVEAAGPMTERAATRQRREDRRRSEGERKGGRAAGSAPPSEAPPSEASEVPRGRSGRTVTRSRTTPRAAPSSRGVLRSTSGGKPASKGSQAGGSKASGKKAGGKAAGGKSPGKAGPKVGKGGGKRR
jgi:ribonuclease R